jgi:hypothetical protein
LQHEWKGIASSENARVVTYLDGVIGAGSDVGISSVVAAFDIDAHRPRLLEHHIVPGIELNEPERY